MLSEKKNLNLSQSIKRLRVRMFLIASHPRSSCDEFQQAVFLELDPLNNECMPEIISVIGSNTNHSTCQQTRICNECPTKSTLFERSGETLKSCPLEGEGEGRRAICADNALVYD